MVPDTEPEVAESICAFAVGVEGELVFSPADGLVRAGRLQPAIDSANNGIAQIPTRAQFFLSMLYFLYHA
jgi:hypothetical protein